MKIRIELSDEAIEGGCETVIRCREVTDEVLAVKKAVEEALSGNELSLSIGSTDYFVPLSDILFFETDGDAVKAHTAERIYSSVEKLCRLEERLPRRFVRVSKSCIVNSSRICSLSRGLTGTAEACFFGSAKRAYVSRMYFNSLKNLIYETRLTK